MTPEEREILENTHRLAEENNHMLRKLYRGYKWGRALKILYWVVILGVSFGAFWLIQPYVDQIKDAYGKIGQNIETAQNASDEVKNFFGQ